MSRWEPKHQFTKSVRDFSKRIPGVLFGKRGEPPSAPRLSFAVRIGAAGPLALPKGNADLSRAISAILTALKQYADEANSKFHQCMFSDGSVPPPRLKFTAQLASGFDQLAASAALAMGYSLNVVLPGSRAAFAESIHENAHEGAGVTRSVGELGPADRGDSGSLAIVEGAERDHSNPADAIEQFGRLLEKADHVLELDRDDESNDEASFTKRDYSQAGILILDHSDLVLAAVHDELLPALGGTRWIAQRAEEMGLPVLEVPVDRPFGARLIWSADGHREERPLFRDGSSEAAADIFSQALNDRLFGPAFDLSKTRLGSPERRFIAEFNPEFNERYWSERWQLDDSVEASSTHSLGGADHDIERDLKEVKVWADLRASAMAELVRGSFIFSVLLGLVAVFGALLGVFLPILSFGVFGKLLEIFCLGAVFWLMLRSQRCEWRSHWLSLRQLERYIEQTVWLRLLGRCRVFEAPSHLAQFQTGDVAKWTNAYFRALIRNSSFPTARFTADYLKTVQALALRNLVVAQISYLRQEEQFHQKSDDVLEWWTRACVLAAGVFTVAYLLYFLMETTLSAGPHEVGLGRAVGALGALLTAIATALSAIRSHGEYGQIAARYGGTWQALQRVQVRLAPGLPDGRSYPSSSRLRSARLASTIGEATDILIAEVQGWRAILQKKEIDPT